MMDSAIDTLSTTSEHSVASSSESTTAMQSSKRSSHSPSNYSSNHTGSTGGSINGSGGGGNGNNNRSSSSIGIHHQHHLTTPIGQSSLNGNLNNIINIGGVNNNNNNHHRRSISPTSSPPPLPSQSSLSQIPLSHRGGSSGGHPSSPPSSAAALSHQQMMQQMQHQLSPPHVSTPNSLGVQMGPRGISHLPPHSLGLLNSLQMMHHASPLELMAAAHHHAGVPPRSYNSPPPISTSDPSANECKLVEYRGQKVAAFIISGDTMLCLPQAFELFLKHLVGGLHTVYTKLKRLDIVPLVCNVEQVRILRGLGAIQPGVNRCKLLSCKDFDILYRDCTTARCLSIKPPERPGRPPKRGPVGLSLAPTHLSGHPQLKKHRLDNGDYAYENGHITDISRLDKSPLLANGYNPPPINHMAFMQMNHHPGSALMSPGMPPHGLHRPDGQMMKAAAQAAAAAGGMSAAAGMDAIARSGIWENCRAAYEDIVKHLERNYRLREERTDDGRPPIIDQKPRDLSSRNGSPGRQSPVLNLSKSGIGPGDDNVSNLGDGSDRSDTGVQSPQPSVHGDNDNLSEDNITDDEAVRNDKEEDLSDTEEHNLSQRPASVTNIVTAVNVNTTEQAHLAHQRAINYSTLAAASAVAAASSSGSAVCVTSPHNDSVVGHPDQQTTSSSTETLLRNIQSLLKVAADNAKQQERQITYEKAELKMDVLREREVKDSLERQLVEERKLRVLYQKRYRRERKIRIRLQQQIEGKRKSLNPDDHQQFKGLSDSGKNCQDGVENKNNIKTEKLPPNERNHRRSSESPAAYNTRSSSSGGGITEERGNSGETSSSTTVRNIQTSDRNNERIGSSGIDREGSTNHLQTGSGGGSTTNSGAVSSQVDGGAAVGASGIVGNGGSSNKGWNYPGIDLMASGAFWQNYSETLAQEIEMERKARQQNSDRDVKSPLQERQQAYYKNSVLFGSAT